MHTNTELILLAIEDVTEPRGKEDELKASEVRYRRLFETAQDGILILDAETGKIIDVNPFLLELLGCTHAELLGKELSPHAGFAVNEFRKGFEKRRVWGRAPNSTKLSFRIDSVMTAHSCSCRNPPAFGTPGSDAAVRYDTSQGSGANAKVAGDDEEMQRFVPIEDLFKGRHFDGQIIIWCVAWYTTLTWVSYCDTFREIIA